MTPAALARRYPDAAALRKGVFAWRFGARWKPAWSALLVDRLHDKVLARTPAGRWGDPADFGGIAVFLASAASDFVTGTAIPVDGGYSIQG